ncbi:MAG: ABC transporter substrate-binding protein [Elioraea sp.]|nr:ABC transporter substrate-binding protein [Elioraea sp.]MDW8445646.1 ABC transporter substrate-binding protein [Acetobacteraceae bacterium]
MLTRRSALAAAVALAGWPASASPSRLVVAGGGIAEIVCALGLRPAIVGVDTTSLFPSALKALPNVGYQRNLNAEGVLALRPDLVLVSAQAGPPEVLERLERAGVRVVRVAPIDGPQALLASIPPIGDALGRAEQAAQLARAIAEDLDRLARSIAAQPRRPRAVFVLALGGGAPQASGSGTAADVMLRLAGAENVVGEYRGYRPVAAEALLAKDPEAVVTTSHTLDALGGIEGLRLIPSLAVLEAVRRRRVISFETLYLLGFGPRIAHAARDLAAALHGEGRIATLPHRPWLEDVS